MKTLRIILIQILCSTSILFAQDKKPVKDKVDAMKIGFMTEKLELTPEEAQTFWPVYNAYSDELHQLRKGRRENLVNTKENFDEMSSSELEKSVDNEITFRSGELEILKKYHPQFKKVLPIKKVAKLYKAEEDFKRRLLEMIQDRNEGRRGPMKQRHGR